MLARNKVPEVTLMFWLTKVMTTTVGETIADYLAVDAGLGQGLTRTVMATLLALALWMQMRSRQCRLTVYWLTVVLISVVGTQITDALTDGMGVSLYLSTGVFAAVLLGIFLWWHRQEGTLSIQAINSPHRESFYWLCILCTFALGTAAGDLATEALGLGFQWGALAFGGLIALTAVAHRFGLPTVPAFWAAYILTRPLGAALGDWLSQDPAYGGLGLGASWTSLIFLAAIVALVTCSRRLTQGGHLVSPSTLSP